LKETQ